MKIFELKSVCVGVMAVYALTNAWAMAVELEKPTANLTEGYNSSAGWVNNFDPNANKASAGWTNGYLMASYQGAVEGAQPIMQKTLLVGLTNSSDGRFSGNFSKITAVSVDVQILNSPTLIFYFKSTRDIVWKRQIQSLPANTVSGEWVNITIALDPNSWTTNGWSYMAGTNLADFVTDKANICQFGFEVQRNNSGQTGTSDNRVCVDNVKLIGPWGQSLVNGAVPLAWLMEHNLTETDADGYMNVASMLFGTNPSGSNAALVVDIGRNAQGKPIVKWNDNKYVVFDLLKTSDLNAPFSPVAGAEGLVGTGSSREIQVDDSAPGAHFFKVGVRPAQ